MSEGNVPVTPAQTTGKAMAAGDPSDAGTTKVIYILYLVGIVVGVTAIVGVVMAYVYKAEAPEWVQSHYRFQIRTFWIGVLYSIIGSITAPIFIGYLIFLFVLVWLVMRCVKGMGWAEKGQPVENVETWMIP
jgi:uncharacterized membrane protein